MVTQPESTGMCSGCRSNLHDYHTNVYFNARGEVVRCVCSLCVSVRK